MGFLISIFAWACSGPAGASSSFCGALCCSVDQGPDQGGIKVAAR